MNDSPINNHSLFSYCILQKLLHYTWYILDFGDLQVLANLFGPVLVDRLVQYHVANRLIEYHGVGVPL